MKRIDLNTLLTGLLATALVGVVTFHELIWPCDIGPAANRTETATALVYDSTANVTQRPTPQPVAVVYRNAPQLPVAVPDAAPMVAHITAATAPLAVAHSAGATETSYYIDCLSDTVTSVRACVRDSIRGSRIVWREWETANLRPTITATVTEHRPDRWQVYVGPRLAAIRPTLGQWEPMGGAGLRVKTRSNWMMGASYLHGLHGSQAITLDADVLIRVPGIADRQRAKRAAKVAKSLN